MTIIPCNVYDNERVYVAILEPGKKYLPDKYSLFVIIMVIINTLICMN